MYEKYLEFLDLVFEMQASNDGIGYEDITSKLNVSRRTAERMMEAIVSSYKDNIEVIQRRPKRWRIVRKIEAPSPTVEELAVLNTAAELFEREGMHHYQQYITNLQRNLKANIEHKKLTRLDPDIETLEAAEVFSHRPGPVQKLEEGLYEQLRDAIKGFNPISFDYTNAKGETKRHYNAHPYGFLHGNHTRSYLLAAINPETFHGLTVFILTNVSKLVVYENQVFEKVEDNSVEDYLKDCFGVFRDNRVYTVVWRFNAECADHVKKWVFHPTQKMKELRDGRIEVQFRAGGLYEMAWHVITWGDLIEVVRPKKLIDVLRDVRDSIRLSE